MSQPPICPKCHQPEHGEVHCDEAASPEIRSLLAQARGIRAGLELVEQKLFDLDYNFYTYITGVHRRSERT